MEDKDYDKRDVPREKLEKAYNLVQKYTPEFKDIPLDEVKYEQFFASFRSTIICFECDARKVVYKNVYNDFTNTKVPSFYRETLEAIKSADHPKYSKGLIYFSDDLSILIEDFIEGSCVLAASLNSKPEE